MVFMGSVCKSHIEFSTLMCMRKQENYCLSKAVLFEVATLRKAASTNTGQIKGSSSLKVYLHRATGFRREYVICIRRHINGRVLFLHKIRVY